MATPSWLPAVERVLERAKSIGFLGPGPVRAHVEHARAFSNAYTAVTGTTEPSVRCMDLGSGGGVPGLVLAMLWPSTSWVLLDAGERRAAFLRSALVELNIQDRVSVVRGRAEELAREEELRGGFDLVTARGFAPPAVTAECASGFLVVGGLLVVSEPPEERDRWNADALATLHLEQLNSQSVGSAVFRSTELVDDRFPRRTGIPAKRPLF